MHLVVLDTLDSLLATSFGDLDLLNHGLDVVLRSKLQHGQHLGAVTQVVSTHVATVGGELLDHEVLDGVVGKTAVVEGTVDLEDGEVGREVEVLGHVGGVDDEVELELVGLVPVLLLCADEVLSTELQGILLLVSRVRDDGDISTESRSPKNGEVTETTPESV